MGPDIPIDAGEQPLYAAHRKIYPRDVTGLFARLRVLSVLALLGLYYVMPWVRWDGRPAILCDLPGRKFYLFGFTFFPQDLFLLTWLLVIAALSLFFFTALAGRLWCGFACPQTVWTEAYLWMERLAEGNRTRRMKLDRGPGRARRSCARRSSSSSGCPSRASPDSPSSPTSCRSAISCTASPRCR